MNISLSEHFTYGKLLKFTFPSVLMMVFTSIYGVVDGIFVSNFVGSDAFAAVNLIMPFLMIFGAVGFMIGAGGTALVAFQLGMGAKKRANEIFSLLVYLLIAVGLVFTVVGLVYLEPVARFLGADDVMLPYCLTYGRILMPSLIPFMLQNVFQNFMVTAERPQFGLCITVGAGVTNIVLDAVLVGWLRLGVAGAAYATFASECVGGLIPLVYFLAPNKSLLRLGKTHFDGWAIQKACTNGSSEFMTNVSMSLVNALYNWQLMRYMGADGVSVFGVIMYVDFIFVSMFLGYSMGSAPIVGYHYGAANYDELKSLLRKSLAIISVTAVLMLAAAEGLNRPLSRIFVGYDAELLDMTAHAFGIYAVSFLLCGFNIYTSSFFTALNNGAISALVSFAHTLVFQSISILALPMPFGGESIWYAVIVSEALTLILSAICLLTHRKKYNYA